MIGSSEFWVLFLSPMIATGAWFIICIHFAINKWHMKAILLGWFVTGFIAPLISWKILNINNEQFIYFIISIVIFRFIEIGWLHKFYLERWNEIVQNKD